MTTVTIEEAQARLPELIEQAAAGEEVVIVRDDQAPVRLQLSPSIKPPRRKGLGKPSHKFGFAKGGITFMADDFDAPLDDFREYME